MIIFLYGPDTYRSRQKLFEIVNGYKKIHQSGLNLRFFDLKQDNFQDFKDFLFSTSMFKEKKLIILKNASLNQEFREKFFKERKKFRQAKEIILFYEKGEVSAKDRFFNFLLKNGKFQKFNLLDGEKLKNWVKKEFEKHLARVEEKALEKLIEFVGNNLWQLSNEIKKLINYKKGQNFKELSSFTSAKASVIEVKDVDLLVKPKIETDIFKTIDVLALKNKKRALELLHEHLEKGDSPLYLLSMINFQFRNLLLVKSCELGYELYGNYIQRLAEELGMHPFVLRKTIQQARKFTLEELKKIYQKIFEIDFNIKTGKMEPETALDLFIAEI